MTKRTPAQTIDLLRTMFAEMWDGAADFLDAINQILEDTIDDPGYDMTVSLDPDGSAPTLTWRDAEAAWHAAPKDIRGIPTRQDVVARLKS